MPRWSTCRHADWGVLLRCLWLIPAVEFNVRFRPPCRWLPGRDGDVPGENFSRAAAGGESISRWVDAAYRRSPFTPTCLTRSLVLYRILRARGIPCRLRAGMRKEQKGLAGHAWVQSAPGTYDDADFDVTLSF